MEGQGKEREERRGGERRIRGALLKPPVSKWVHPVIFSFDVPLISLLARVLLRHRGSLPCMFNFCPQHAFFSLLHWKHISQTTGELCALLTSELLPRGAAASQQPSDRSVTCFVSIAVFVHSFDYILCSSPTEKESAGTSGWKHGFHKLHTIQVKLGIIRCAQKSRCSASAGCLALELSDCVLSAVKGKRKKTVQ